MVWHRSPISLELSPLKRNKGKLTSVVNWGSPRVTLAALAQAGLRGGRVIPEGATRLLQIE